MYLAEIDCEVINSKIEFMKAMDNAFGFPSYFGENWDALWDCMRDLYWIKENEIKVKIMNSEFLPQKLKLDINLFFEDLKIYLEKNNTNLEIKYIFTFDFI
ncbi:MAG: barstar family protein [Flavobacteriia bacterium]